MRALFFLMLALPAAALDNGVRLAEATGAAVPARPYTVFRFFAEGEFPDYAQPRANAIPADLWQNDVKTRWPDGSLQQTYVSLWIPAMTAGQVVTVDFVAAASPCHLESRAACEAAALTKQQMLDFDAGGGSGSWGAKLTASQNSITHTASARSMLTAWDGTAADLATRYWLRGPVVTEMIVEDATPVLSHDFGWQWDAGTSQWITAPNAAYESLHPIFVLRFYPSWPGVRADVIVQNMWTTKLQRQYYTPAIYTGGLENGLAGCAGEARLPCSTTEPVTHTRGSSRHWLVWSGQEPPAIHADLNLPYLIHSKLLPQYQYWRTPGAEGITNEMNEYNSRLGTDADAQTCSSASYCGQWFKGLRAPGTRGDIAFFPRWFVHYLGTMGSEYVSLATKREAYRKWLLGNADAGATPPYQLRESDSTNRTYGGTGQRDQFFSRHDSTPAFGRIFSVNSRPTIWANSGYDFNSGMTVDRLIMHCTGSTLPCAGSTYYPANVLGWQFEGGMDLSHLPQFNVVPAMVTGDWYYLQLVKFAAANAVSCSWNTLLKPDGSGGDGNGHGHELGLIQSPGVNWRTYPWTLRDLYWGTVLEPDGTPEKAYFREKYFNNARVAEGQFNITDGHYPPQNYTDSRDAVCTGWSKSAYPYLQNSYTLNSHLSLSYGYNLWCVGRKGIVYNGMVSALGMAPVIVRSASKQSMDPAKVETTSTPHQFLYGLVTWGVLVDTNLVRDGNRNPFYYVFQVFSRSWAERTLRPEARPIELRAIVAPELDSATGQPFATWPAFGDAYARYCALDSDITSSATTLDVNCMWNGPTTGGINYYYGNEYPSLKIEGEWVQACSWVGNSPAAGKTRVTLCAGGRGKWGTVAAAHTAGTQIDHDLLYWHPSYGARNFTGFYPYYVYGALGMAAGIGYPEPDRYTRRRAHEWLGANLPRWNYAGPNASNCYGQPGECDNWQWLWEPRDRIVNPIIKASAGGVTMTWVAPGGAACRAGLASSEFASSYDDADAVAAAAGRVQSYSAAGLDPGQYGWRITCGTARVRGMVTVP